MKCFHTLCSIALTATGLFESVVPTWGINEESWSTVRLSRSAPNNHRHLNNYYNDYKPYRKRNRKPASKPKPPRPTPPQPSPSPERICANITSAVCGQVFDTDNQYIVLDGLLDCSTGQSGINGITIAADSVVLDCQDHELIGDFSAIGIYVGNASNVVIKDCQVENWFEGIRLEYSVGTLLIHASVLSNTNGMVIQGEDSSLSSASVFKSRFTGNQVGLFAYEYTSLFVSDSTFTENNNVGIGAGKVAVSAPPGSATVRVVDSLVSNTTCNGIAASDGQEIALYAVQSCDNNQGNAACFDVNDFGGSGVISGIGVTCESSSQPNGLCNCPC